MKPFVLLAVAFAAFSAVRAGVVLVQEVESEGQFGEIILTLDGERVRADLSPAVSILIDGESGEQVTLMHQMKQYLKMSAKEGKRLAEGVEEISRESGSAAAPKLVATGKREKVGKYVAERYTFETGSLKATYWIAEDFPDSDIILKALGVLQRGSTAAATESVLPGPESLPGVPVKTEVMMGDRKVTNTLVSVVFGPVDARQFEVPAEYIATEKVPVLPMGRSKAPAPRGP